MPCLHLKPAHSDKLTLSRNEQVRRRSVKTRCAKESRPCHCPGIDGSRYVSTALCACAVADKVILRRRLKRFVVVFIIKRPKGHDGFEARQALTRPPSP